MNLATIIQDRTNDGADIVEFLVAVMRNELAGFKPCHRLDVAKLLVRYDCNCKPDVAIRAEELDYVLNTPPEPSRPRSDSGSSSETEFDNALARVIRQSTDDGRSVCRFLINVMEGELKAFKPHHRIAAARELLRRGFGKQAYTGARASRPYKAQAAPPHSSEEAQAEADPETNQHTEHEEDPAAYEERWAKVWEIVNREKPGQQEKQPEPDPDNPPHVPDDSAFDEAMENSQKWFEEWKNSLDPQEYQAIIKETSERFRAKLDARIERRKQIAKDRERREKEEAERQAQQTRARAEAKAKAESEPEEPDPGPPPAKEDHERWSPTPSIPTSFRLRNCGHPKCKLHDGPIYYPEDDRSSPYYFDGRVPMGAPASVAFDELMARRRPP